jgi:hypothetical protein
MATRDSDHDLNRHGITRASIGRHPIHPMLIALAIGLWVFSRVTDIFAMITDSPVWRDVAFYTLAGRTVSAVLAAIPVRDRPHRDLRQACQQDRTYTWFVERDGATRLRC